ARARDVVCCTRQANQYDSLTSFHNPDGPRFMRPPIGTRDPVLPRPTSITRNETRPQSARHTRGWPVSIADHQPSRQAPNQCYPTYGPFPMVLPPWCQPPCRSEPLSSNHNQYSAELSSITNTS